MDVLTSIAGNFSQDTLTKVAVAAGIDATTATKAFGAIAPLMVGKMAENASTQGADVLHGALDKHDGSVFSNLGNLGAVAGDGEKILGHVFGGDVSGAATQVATIAGIDPAQAQKIMAIVAPLVMGALGKAKKESGMDAGTLVQTLGGLSSMLGGTQGMANAAGVLVGTMKNNGNGLGNILGMLGGLLGKK